MFAVEHWDVEPDIVVDGQGDRLGPAAVGHPRQARQLLEKWPPGTHGGTYGGNVVSCAAANATLDVIEDEGLVENAAARGSAVPGRAAGARRLATARSATCAASA